MSEKCVCCLTNYVGKSKVMCTNCWSWMTEKITMGDVTMILAMLSHRDTQDKHAKEICQYLVADNYMQGKASLRNDV